jgi:predicted dienelactone hydrolase
MNRIPARLAIAFCVAATLTQAAGLRFIDVPADAGDPALTGAVWSPCAAPTQDVMLRGVTVPGVTDCPITGEKLPLVVVSHGRRGSFGGHHDTAETLADAGFVVAAINHPGDNASDPSRSGDLSVLIERPNDIKRLVDFMLTAWPDAARIDHERIGFFGFSRGAYTGLVVIGGNPDFRRAIAICEGSTAQMCEQIRENKIPPGPLTHDPRIRAAILADPIFTVLFPPDGLKEVAVPIQLWGSEVGGDGVLPEDVAAMDRRLPSRPDYRVEQNAGHFAFLAPCSAEQARAAPEVCTDPPGFDRVAFHKEFDGDVLAFFREHLVEARKP